jgi:cyclase
VNVLPVVKFHHNVALCILFTVSSSAQTFTSSHFQIELLAPGVYAAIATENGYAGSNSGIVDLGDKTIIFDTFLTPVAARDLQRAAEQLTHHPIAFVVNSHFHNDHIRGNQVFAPDVEIISTTKTRDAIKHIEPEQIKWEIQNVPQLLLDTQDALENESDDFLSRDLRLQLAYYKAVNESDTELKTRLPNLTFDEKLTIDGATRKVDLISVGGGHTPGDCIMLLPDEHIAFVGDLVSIGFHPYMPDGSPEEWKATLKKMELLPIGTIVPGHGGVGNRADITIMSDYIDELENLVTKMLIEGKTEADVSSEPVLEHYESWLHRQNYVENLRFLFRKGTGGPKTR